MAALRIWRREESPGSTEARCRVTPGGGDPRESATESTPPVRRCIGRPVRVKRRGKSAPRRRQRRRQGKPHREQDQVGAAGIRGAIPRCRASLRTAARVGRMRRSATSVPEEWPSPPRVTPRWDRTRLTSRLAPLPNVRTFQELFCRSRQSSRQRCCSLWSPSRRRLHDVPDSRPCDISKICSFI
jgi:hypothetical protein